MGTVKTLRSAAVAAGILALSLAASGCGCGGPEVETVSPPVEKEHSPEPELPSAVWPLTGIAVDEVSETAALAIKVENSPAARPQVGLEYADIVWETVVEGGISRFIAVYHSQLPETVEPVRSARPMDLDVVAALEGILVYSGAQGQFIRMFNDAGIQSIIMDSGHAGFSRDPLRRAPHNVIGVPQTFLDQANDSRAAPPPAQNAFAAEPGAGSAMTGGTPADTITANLSSVQTTTWTWDAETESFLRANGTVPSVNAEGEQHAATNVVLIAVDVVSTQWRDAGGAAVPETIMTGTGNAIVAAGGKYVEATWSREDRSSIMHLQDADGNEIELEQGDTWILTVPNGTGNWVLPTPADTTAADEPSPTD
ncbi:MAG: DUF3048 domain-containing protein [Cellulomonadaceae bacterium]|nr:DUF3048 domain-containing protein [Cellulomonadaceae bacterium]